MIESTTEFSVTDKGLELSAKSGLNTAEMAYRFLGLEANSCQTIPTHQYNSSRFSWSQTIADSLNSVDDINHILNGGKALLRNNTFADLFCLEYCHISIDDLHFDYSLDSFSGEWIRS